MTKSPKNIHTDLTNTTMTFGKYKGIAIEDVPSEYLEWAVGAGMDPARSLMFRAEIARRGVDGFVPYKPMLRMADTRTGAFRVGKATHHLLNGLLNNENGPAVIHDNGNFRFCLDGRSHRTDGPAIKVGERFTYALNGKVMGREAFVRAMADESITIETLIEIEKTALAGIGQVPF